MAEAGDETERQIIETQELEEKKARPRTHVHVQKVSSHLTLAKVAEVMMVELASVLPFQFEKWRRESISSAGSAEWHDVPVPPGFGCGETERKG